jgi:hypothetical protein
LFSTLLALLMLLATAAGNAAAQDPGEKGPEAGMPSQVVSPLLGPIVSGTLDASDPTFTRPDVSAAVTVNCVSAWAPVIGVDPYYEAHAFHVTNNSPIQIEVNAAGTTIGDTFLVVSCQPFNAATSTVNGVISDDDDGAGLLSAITLADNVRLTPGKTYWVVITTYGPGFTGAYQLDFGDNVVLGTPPKKWAWSTNAGWINFAPTAPNGVFMDGAAFYPDHLEGFAWSENAGWIRLGTHTTGGSWTYSNAGASDYGVNRNPSTGALFGFAWSSTSGWINFAPTFGGVTVDGAGNFAGYAWGENLGWIKFNGTAGGTTPYQVQVRCVLDVNASGAVNVIDVQLVTSAFGMNVPAYDFNKDGVINVLDIQFVAQNWLVGC